MKKMLRLVSVVLSVMLAFGCLSLPVLADDAAQTSAFETEFSENYTAAVTVIGANGSKAWDMQASKDQWQCSYPVPTAAVTLGDVTCWKFPFGKDTNVDSLNRVYFGSTQYASVNGAGFSNDNLYNVRNTGIIKMRLYIEAGNDDSGNAVTNQLSDIEFWFVKSDWNKSAEYTVSGLTANEWHDLYIPLSVFELNDLGTGEITKQVRQFAFITSKATNVENYNICIGQLQIYQRDMLLNEVAVADGKASLTWKNSVPASEGTVAAYKLYRDGSLLTTISDVNTLTYTDATATADEVHEYYVDAVDANGAILATSNKRYPVVYGKDTVKKVSIYTNTNSGAMQPKSWNISESKVPKFLTRADDSMAIPEGEVALGMQWKDTSEWNAQALIPNSGTIDLSKVDQSGYMTFKIYLDTSEYSQWQTPIDSLNIALANENWANTASYSIPASEITNNKWQCVKIPMSAFSAIDYSKLQEISFSFPTGQGYLYKLYVQDIAFTMPKLNRDETEVVDSTGSTVTAVEAGKTYSANITAYNHSDAAVTPTFVAALYRGNSLADVAVISNAAVSADGEHTFTHSFDVPNEDGNYEIKAFLFDDFNNLTPYPYVK